MKSTTTYEMHNYASNTTPTVSRGDGSTNEAASTSPINSVCEKYSLRHRQKRRTAAVAAAELINAASSNCLSDDNCNNYNNNNNAIDNTHLESPKSTGSYDAVTTAAIKSRKRSNTIIPNNNNNNSSHTSINSTIASARAPATTTPTSTSTPMAKVKSKAAPLSKYRRKTANARERTRMREINSAFETLRHCVPHTITGDETTQSSEKLSKITTLRLAMKYIRILSEALSNPSFEAEFLLECKRDGDHRFTAHDWQTQQQQKLLVNEVTDDYDGEQETKLARVENDRKNSTKARCSATSKGSKSVKTRNSRVKSTRGVNNATTCADNSSAMTHKAPTRRQTRKQKFQQNFSPYNSNSHSSPASTCSSVSTPAYASLSSITNSPPCSNTSNSSSCLHDSPLTNAGSIENPNQSMSDLSNLLFESDGESLHFSEPSLSPTSHGVITASSNTSLPTSTPSLLSLAYTNKHQHVADMLSPFDQHLAAMASTLENPLELSLRLLDSSAHSLEFSATSSNGDCGTADQHDSPPDISPLGALDTFNSFSDLLHIDFPEHNALDLFLS